jgi:flavin-dependent dehydrogenase
MAANPTSVRGFAALVLGTGPSGSAAAAELARHGFPTALVGRSGDQRPNIGECLPPGIRPQLEKACVWDDFLRAGHMPSVGIRSIWGSTEPADRDFVMSPYGAGWHIDRGRFDLMMRDAALRSGASWLECHALRDVERMATGWRLKFASPSGDYDVEAPLVIDATGRASVFARRAGAKRRSLDHMVGVAGYFSSHEVLSSIEPVILVEAVENGWWYTAPLPGGKLIAVFMTEAGFIQRHKITQAAPWLELLDATVAQGRRIREHGCRLDGEIRVVQAESSFLDHIVGDCWIAAGDAAAAFDPLSSQGITAAVSSGLSAAQTAVAWFNGDEEAPLAFARRARGEYARYLTNRSVYYSMEQRWPESDFWKMRQKVSPAGSEVKEILCV